MPSFDYALLLVELIILAVCAKLAWQAHSSVCELRELLEGSRDVLGELREALAVADRQQLLAGEPAAIVPASVLEGRDEALAGLASLGLGAGEIAQRVGISRGEAELLVKLGRQRAAGRRA